MEKFVITDFNSILTAQDRKGQKREFTNRRYACFIITLSGKIRFVYKNGEIISEPGSPIFLPQGLTYTNECLENAESYVFNFTTLSSYSEPLKLSPIPEVLSKKCYCEIESKAFSPSLKNTISIFETLYALSGYLMASFSGAKSAHPIVEKALDFMRRNIDRADLSTVEIAANCCISEVYLRKLFRKHLDDSPFQKLTEIRMEKASILVHEKRPLAEICERVGYSDVPQFVRAYKRHFGHSPSNSI